MTARASQCVGAQFNTFDVNHDGKIDIKELYKKEAYKAFIQTAKGAPASKRSSNPISS
jgi:Ca2+-binding EF-hand superfamily protein